MITIYCLDCCPNCEEAKRLLKLAGKEFMVRPMDSPDSITEMRVNGYFGIEAPVIQVGDDFYGFHEFFED